MHRSQALSGAFTMRRARGAAARNGAVSERLNTGKLIFVVCDSASAGRQDHAASYYRGHGQDCAVHGTGRYRARTISRSLIAPVPPAACSRRSTRPASRPSLRLAVAP